MPFASRWPGWATSPRLSGKPSRRVPPWWGNALANWGRSRNNRVHAGTAAKLGHGQG